MKIYIVIGYCNYYPAPDNTLGVFLSYEKAKAFRDERARDGRGYLDFYEVVEHEVVE